MRNFVAFTFVLVFSIVSAAIQDVGHQIPVLRQCNYYMGEVGWRCNSGDCIPEKYVCDTNQQCYPDESDEDEGCNLYPETGCKSWKGRKYVKCPDGEHCAPAGSIDTDCAPLTVSDDDPLESSSKDGGTRFCVDDPFGWRCDDGFCIPLENVCDGKTRCSDGSDEKVGCQLYPETGCPSYFGVKHEACVDRSNDGEEFVVCTLPEFLDAGQCRNCSDPSEWRCDSGWCIPRSNVLDGIPHCRDGSDERRFVVGWWWIFIITITMTGVGMCVMFCFRLIVLKKHLLYCGRCSAIRSHGLRNVMRVERGRQNPDADTVDFARSVGYEETSLPMRLITILDDEHNWRRKSFRSHTDEGYGKHLYASVHQRPLVYRNLYRYLVMRYGTSDKLVKISQLLFRWEKDFHDEDEIEVLKCWRLHLGSCLLLKRVLASAQPPGCLDQLQAKIVLPVRNQSRSLRQKLPHKLKTNVTVFYRLAKLIFHACKPFVSASFFYFEILKNLAFVYIIYTTLYDMVEGHLTDQSVYFETSLVSVLIGSTVVVYILFCVISLYCIEEAFEMWVCRHFSGPKRILLKVFAVLFAPVMPIFLLANHAYCEEKVHSLTRDLQTCGDVAEDESEEKLVETFKEIQRYERRSQVHSGSYSMFRTVYAVIGSSTMIVSMFLIVLVSGQPGRKVKLMDGVLAKIGAFANVVRSRDSEADSLLEQLNLARDVVFLGSTLFSSLMVVSALTKHVFHSKAKNMTIGGQLMLSAYFACHSLCRMTIFIIFLSAAPLEDETVVISMLPAAIVVAVLLLLQGISIYFYKWKFIEEFRVSHPAQQMVHLLVNTLVAVPFRRPDVVCMEATDEELPVVRSLDDVSRPSKERFNKRAKSASNLLVFSEPSILRFPDVAGPLLQTAGGLREELERLWWRNPNETLRLSSVRAKLPLRLRMVIGDAQIERTFNYLEENGFINKRLYNPRSTRLEYFWLLSIHFLFNVLSLTLEVANGGISTSVGSYISWDVRLSTFFVGVVFLGLYYRRYHASRNLISLKVSCGCCRLCCCKKAGRDPLQAIPDGDEMQRCLSEPSNVSEKKSMTTQTSMTPSLIGAKDKNGEAAFDQNAALATAIVELQKESENRCQNTSGSTQT